MFCNSSRILISAVAKRHAVGGTTTDASGIAEASAALAGHRASLPWGGPGRGGSPRSQNVGLVSKKIPNSVSLPNEKGPPRSQNVGPISKKIPSPVSLPNEKAARSMLKNQNPSNFFDFS